MLSRAGHAGRFKDVVAEGSTRSQLVRFTGFAELGKTGVYQPDFVTIEDVYGNVVRTWRDPHEAFKNCANDTGWDELFLIFFCGFSIWSYLTTPFILVHADVEVEELAPWRELDQLWRRLHVVFPPSLVTHSLEQTFYFDATGLQRRVDHVLLGNKVAHYSWAHQSFNGITIPTLRRSLALGPDGSVIAGPPLIEVEIFDAAFD